MKKRILSLFMVLMTLCAFAPCVSAGNRHIDIGVEYVIKSGESMSVTIPKDTYYMYYVECANDMDCQVSFGNSSFTCRGKGISIKPETKGEIQFTLTLFDSQSSSTGGVSDRSCKFKIDFLSGQGQCGSNLTWELDPDGKLIIDGIGDMWDWERYQAPWFFGSPMAGGAIKEVIINDGVTSIGNNAFYCTDVRNVTLPGSITSIGQGAFYACTKMENIDLSSGLEIISDNSFYKCSSLVTITIPANVHDIGNTFNDCWSLSDILVDSNNKNFQSKDGVLFNRDITKLIKYPEGKDSTKYDIPNGVKTIGDNAFSHSHSLQNVVIPYGVEVIGEFAFGDTSLDSIKIPASVKVIGEVAFQWCSGLKSIYIEKGIERIGALAFSIGGLDDIYYTGGKSDWDNINMGEHYNELDNVSIHYNAIGTNPPIITGANFVGSTLSSIINVQLTYTEYDSEMITAFYKDGVLVDMQTTPIHSGDEKKDVVIPESIGANMAKIFIWSSLDSMKPLCEVKSVNLNEGEM